MSNCLKDLEELKDSHNFNWIKPIYWLIEDTLTNEVLSNSDIIPPRREMYLKIYNEYEIYTNTEDILPFFTTYLTEEYNYYCTEVSNANLFKILNNTIIDTSYGNWFVKDILTGDSIGTTIKELQHGGIINGRYSIQTNNYKLLEQLRIIVSYANSDEWLNLVLYNNTAKQTLLTKLLDYLKSNSKTIVTILMILTGFILIINVIEILTVESGLRLMGGLLLLLSGLI